MKQKGKTVDIRSVKVGFRKIELAQDGRLLINGKSTLFKGVDRHDHSSENGRTVSKEEMEKVALENDKVQASIGDKTVVKVIAIPKKLINIVVK